MKIVMFGHKRIPSREGGVEVVVGQLSARMAGLGHQIICCNRGGGTPAGERPYRGVTVLRMPTVDKRGLAAVSASFFAAVYAAFSDAQVVHIHAEGPAAMCVLPRLAGKRVVVTVHGLDWQRQKWQGGFGARYIHWGEKMAVRHAHAIIVLSRNMQEYFRRTYSRETVWIPNGVEPGHRRPAEQIREQWGLEQDGYILFLGRLVPEKGISCLLEAFRQVKTGKKLVIAGGSGDAGAYEALLHRMAEQDERVLFTGFVQGRVLEELYSNAYVYVLPSQVEGMSLGLLEAMSYGSCCLVSDIPECTEVVENQALTFRAGDARDLAEKLNSLCAEEALVRHYRSHARSFVCGKYNWDEVTERTLALYQ